MNWFKKLEICKNCKCSCVCKDNIIIRRLSSRLSKRQTKKIPNFFYTWANELDLNDRRQVEIFQTAFQKWEETTKKNRRELPLPERNTELDVDGLSAVTTVIALASTSKDLALESKKGVQGCP
jgi:hypothetical protein